MKKIFITLFMAVLCTALVTSSKNNKGSSDNDDDGGEVFNGYVIDGGNTLKGHLFDEPVVFPGQSGM